MFFGDFLDVLLLLGLVFGIASEFFFFGSVFDSPKDFSAFLSNFSSGSFELGELILTLDSDVVSHSSSGHSPTFFVDDSSDSILAFKS